LISELEKKAAAIDRKAGHHLFGTSDHHHHHGTFVDRKALGDSPPSGRLLSRKATTRKLRSSLFQRKSVQVQAEHAAEKAKRAEKEEEAVLEAERAEQAAQWAEAAARAAQREHVARSKGQFAVPAAPVKQSSSRLMLGRDVERIDAAIGDAAVQRKVRKYSRGTTVGRIMKMQWVDEAHLDDTMMEVEQLERSAKGYGDKSVMTRRHRLTRKGATANRTRDLFPVRSL
jgi:hypothetical protein